VRASTWPLHISRSVARAPPTATGVRRRTQDAGSFRLTRTSCVRKSQSAQVVGKDARPRTAAVLLARAPKLHHRDGGNREPREVKGEDASLVGQVTRIDPTVVRFDAPSAEGEAKAHTRSIGAALFERAE
jgi:hypothetical protein